MCPQFAPVVVFAFNRPRHLARTLKALAANRLANRTDVTVICDGPRNPEEEALTDEVRQVAESAGGFQKISVVRRERNYGLATNIIAGVSELFETHDSLVVLEDDLVVSPYFLLYMNAGLEMYADAPNVASILGWTFPNTIPDPPETFFLRGTDCWGWGAWKRTWSLFTPDALALLAQLREKNLVSAFNCDDSYDYIGMLRDTASGKVSSWAVRWRAVAFLHDMVSLHPGRSLVQEAGSDGSGTHVGSTNVFKVSLSPTPIEIKKEAVRENKRMAAAYAQWHAKLNNKPSN